MAEVKKDLREETRSKWTTTIEQSEAISTIQIQLGCLLRIADATEHMAKNHLQMERDLKWWKDRAERLERENTRLTNEARTLRGVVTRFRNERDALKTQLNQQ